MSSFCSFFLQQLFTSILWKNFVHTSSAFSYMRFRKKMGQSLYSYVVRGVTDVPASPMLWFLIVTVENSILATLDHCRSICNNIELNWRNRANSPPPSAIVDVVIIAEGWYISREVLIHNSARSHVIVLGLSSVLPMIPNDHPVRSQLHVWPHSVRRTISTCCGTPAHPCNSHRCKVHNR